MFMARGIRFISRVSSTSFCKPSLSNISDSLRWEWCQRQPVCLQDFPLRSQVDGILANLLGYLTLCISVTSISVILRPAHEHDLDVRYNLIRSLGALREFLRCSLVDRHRSCVRPG